MTLLNRFRNSQYFDRKNEIKVGIYNDVKDDTGTYQKEFVSSGVQPNSYFTPVERKRIRPEYLDKYSEINYVYLDSKLNLTVEDNRYIVSIDGQEFVVLEYHGYFLTSGFYKYLIGGTGKDVEES